jgi:hypothetical protein
MNEDFLNNVRLEVGIHFRKEGREYLKDKFNALETHDNNKNIKDLYRGTNEFKRSC